MKYVALLTALFALPGTLGMGQEKQADGEAKIGAKAKTDVRHSIVKIHTVRRLPDLSRPWRKSNTQKASGSGVVIDGNRILTNAHVVLYGRQIFVQPYESSDKLPASVEMTAPGMDLAVLKLEDESFFKTRPPVAMAKKLPAIKDTVSVQGYPVGGSNLSITEGIVSRIEMAAYNHGQVGLRMQVDAALNPGNSGGPVLVGDKMVGLVFSVLRQAQNIGYVIPNEEVRTFLDDIKDGKYDGKPKSQEEVQKTENESLRARLGLNKEVTGVMVQSTGLSDADYPIKHLDVITHIGTYDIDNAGMVRIDDNLRLQYHYLVPKLAKDGKVALTVLRGGKSLKINVPVPRSRDALLKPLTGQYPSYFVYGPIVFSPASSTYVAQVGRFRDVLLQRKSPLVHRWSDNTAFQGEELVIITTMLTHRISKGYNNPIAQVVEKINGVRVKNLRHVVEILRDTDSRFIELDFAGRLTETLVFDRQKLLGATEDILSDNGIRKVCSPDLQDVWEPKGKPK